MKRRIAILYPAIVTACLGAAAASAGNIVTVWNQIASTTIVKNAGKSSAASSMWFAYASIAAVNAITGQYRQFYYQGSGPATASLDAAVAAAYHRVLVNYFPSQKDSLDASFATYLAAIGGDPAASEAGAAVGEASAAALIAARTGDGLEANINYSPGSGLGAWIPTPVCAPRRATNTGSGCRAGTAEILSSRVVYQLAKTLSIGHRKFTTSASLTPILVMRQCWRCHGLEAKKTHDHLA